MSLPPGTREARPIGGGDINDAFRVTLADGRHAFVKTRADAAPGEYAAEAAGLRWLAEPGALRTPEVLDVGSDYLALEWIERGSLDAAGAELLGRGLALTHAAGAPHFGDPAPAAAGATTGFGSLRLPNEPAADWPTFYADRRLLPLARVAQQQGALGERGVRDVGLLCSHLHHLAGPSEPPARLHGDLWGGNVIADTAGRPCLIDPSCYGGHREVDLAMLRLFGVPSPRVFAAYEDVAPLAAGWEQRVELWQLAPLLVHAILFGGSYRGAAERVARRYAG